MRGPIQRNTVSLDRTSVSQDRTSRFTDWDLFENQRSYSKETPCISETTPALKVYVVCKVACFRFATVRVPSGRRRVAWVTRVWRWLCIDDLCGILWYAIGGLGIRALYFLEGELGALCFLVLHSRFLRAGVQLRRARRGASC